MKMQAAEAFGKYKNKILNVGVIILAIFLAYKIYDMQNKELKTVAEEEAKEIKKNKVLESISQVEKKTEAYKKFFSKKELGEMVELLSIISKDSPGVQVLSVKSAGAESKHSGYLKIPFEVSVKVANYHALGEFVNKLENYKDFYLVEDVLINSGNFEGNASDFMDRPITVKIKVSTVSYL